MFSVSSFVRAGAAFYIKEDPAMWLIGHSYLDA